MKTAIVVTLAIGELKSKYEALFIPSIKAYANKWGFDFLCIDDYINKLETKHINAIYMQKFLIASFQRKKTKAYAMTQMQFKT
jgi:hypothetical protein